MDVHITARHFKAHDSLRTYVVDSVNKLQKYSTEVVRADMILSFEKAVNSVKVAELHVTVNGTILKALAKTEDFVKSIDEAVEKIGRQIQKYKSKQREKKKITIRKTRAKE
jgi:putative sigma-54 modulation protein